jgi:hypothetical protein
MTKYNDKTTVNTVNPKQIQSKNLIVFAKKFGNNREFTIVPIYNSKNYINYLEEANSKYIFNNKTSKEIKYYNDIIRKHGRPNMVITSDTSIKIQNTILSRFNFDDHNQCFCAEKYEISLKTYNIVLQSLF